jgi:hypothetical protein
MILLALGFADIRGKKSKSELRNIIGRARCDTSQKVRKTLLECEAGQENWQKNTRTRATSCIWAGAMASR